MNLKGIIAISGRPGLFKVVAQGKNNVIVESMIDKKRFPAYASEKISTLEDISIFTYDEDVKLTEVLKSICDKNEGKEGVSHKEDLKVLEKELKNHLPNYDQERVYPSDIRKVFQWYNLLQKADLLKPEEMEAPVEEKPSKESKPKKEEPKKKTTVAAVPSAKAAKPASVKKAAPVKTGSSRGK
ncbi:MAG: DUF5606 domain-containing protein [Bacteroidetes bacterium]|nr:DUF5606 domain-containing protein [Bacteroidota bacterium]